MKRQKKKTTMTKNKKKQVKKTTKKTVPKKVVRQAPRQVQGAMAIIPYDQIAKPEMHKGKYNLVPTKFNNTQIMAIIAPTPKNIIKSRPGKGGGNWDYIPGWWFKKKLNYVFGFDGWSTQIDGERIDGNFITVKGRLIIHNTKNAEPLVTKTDFGGAEIKFKKGTKDFLDLGNDFKAAQTDLIKRCCVQLGFAMDIYGKGESQEMGQAVEPEPQAPAPAPAKGGKVVDAEVTYVPEHIECWHDAEPVTKAEAEFSKKIYGVPLCRKCQDLAKRGVITIKK